MCQWHARVCLPVTDAPRTPGGAAGAMRECLEEAGVAVRLTGLLALESGHGGRWLR